MILKIKENWFSPAQHQTGLVLPNSQSWPDVCISCSPSTLIIHKAMNSGCIHNPEWHCNADALKHLQCTVGPLDTSFLSVPKKKNLVVNELSGSLTLPPVYPLSFFCSYTTRKKLDLSPRSNKRQECCWVSNFFLAFICKSAHKLCQTCTVSQPRMAHRPLLLPLKGKLIQFKAQLWSAVAVGGAWEEERRVAHIQHLV